MSTAAGESDIQKFKMRARKCKIQCDGRIGTETHFGNSADRDRCATVTDHGMDIDTGVTSGSGFRAGAAEPPRSHTLRIMGHLDATIHLLVLAAGRQREAEVGASLACRHIAAIVTAHA